MMVVVKTDTNIYLNVEEFMANKGRSEEVGFHNMWIERPGLYIKTADCDEYVPIIYCDAGKARKMLCDIASEIGRYRADGLVFVIHDGEISHL